MILHFFWIYIQIAQICSQCSKYRQAGSSMFYLQRSKHLNFASINHIILLVICDAQGQHVVFKRIPNPWYGLSLSVSVSIASWEYQECNLENVQTEFCAHPYGLEWCSPLITDSYNGTNFLDCLQVLSQMSRRQWRGLDTHTSMFAWKRIHSPMV